jgi:pilus assembly protein TadC
MIETKQPMFPFSIIFLLKKERQSARVFPYMDRMFASCAMFRKID